MNLQMLAIDLIEDEGFRSKPYRCTRGKLSIGYGRNLEDRGITVKEARMMLDNDMVEVYTEMQRRLPWFSKLQDGRQRALCRMAFQLGVGGLMGFKKMLAALAVGDYVSAHKEALDSEWAKQTPERAARIAALILHG